ncbi:MAG: hypothetical protein RMJ98_10260 [Myxococcales bacterium]|nr:hypothetical protein [Polyangiaceae bacterium]MDW8249670.1 hypothetical protein [Myxococcales bacterium]
MLWSSEENKTTDSFRRWVFPVLLVAGLLLFGSVVRKHTPLEHWLSFRYLACWLAILVFLVACLCGGYPVVRRLASPGFDAPSHLLLSLAVGVYLFFLAIFVLGLLALLHPAVFFLLPLAMMLAGGPALLRGMVTERIPRDDNPLDWVDVFGIAAGVLAVFAVYLPVLVPSQISYDARWYHLAIAEHYAVQGAVRPFQGGWIAGAVPHLASFLYTWAFLAPTSLLFDRIVLSLHLEFLLFLSTLAGVHLLIRALVHRTPRAAWVSLFLFPGILVYDSGLIGGADHVAAFFAPPILLALFQAWRSWDARSALLLAVLLSACFLTKYSSLNIFLPVALAAGLRGLWLLFRGDDRCAARQGLLTLVGGGLLATSPHWLKNWIFYGAPFYPLLTGPFHPKPWTADSPQLLAAFLSSSSIPGVEKPHGLGELLKLLVEFSFVPHDWEIFHGKVPVFGSLFTLLSPVFLLLRSLRLLGVAVLCYGGLVCWAYVGLQDRYLQTLVPWMAAVSGAALLLLWREGGVTRWAAASLVAFQLLWSADHYFIPSNSMLHQSSIRHVTEFFAMGYQKKYEERFELFGDYPRVAQVLPPGARVLVHRSHLHLGLGAPSVLDYPPDSIAIGYGRTRTMREMFELLRRLRVTHLVWPAERDPGVFSLADNLMFHAFVSTYTGEQKITHLWLGKFPDTPPPETPPLKALVLGCEKKIKNGMYPVEKLHVLPQLGESAVYPDPEIPWPKNPTFQQAILANTRLLARDPSCSNFEVPGDFRGIGQWGSFELFYQP